ncbi:MAG: hypothetical protein GVY35_07180 [Bacteroidetes bacterium]|jgi:uncharacterized protein involved in high-affinity Fe2+ transport|nr:hypothetical protein [Bacteroidota bacterium]
MLKVAQRIVTLSVASLLLIAFQPSAAQVPEMVLGEEVVGPGIAITFEGAIKDDVTPREQNLPEADTDVHLEALVHWAEDESIAVPEGATRGGFVGYLHLYAEVTNERTGEMTSVSFTPHITLGDNMHYARNMALPGARTDPYTVTFFVEPPQNLELSFHKSWRDQYGDQLFEAASFTYEGLDFEAIATATRR